jgi:hypothetical protein
MATRPQRLDDIRSEVRQTLKTEDARQALDEIGAAFCRLAEAHDIEPSERRKIGTAVDRLAAALREEWREP